LYINTVEAAVVH